MTQCVEAHPEYYGVPDDMDDDDDNEESVEQEKESVEHQEEKESAAEQQDETTVKQEIETSTQLTPEEIKNEELHSTESISQQFTKQE